MVIPFSIGAAVLDAASVVMWLINILPGEISVFLLITITFIVGLIILGSQNKRQWLRIEHLTAENKQLNDRLNPKKSKTFYYNYHHVEVEFFAISRNGYLSAKRKISMQIVANEQDGVLSEWAWTVSNRTSGDVSFPKDPKIQIVECNRSGNSSDTIQRGFKFTKDKLSYNVVFSPPLTPNETFTFVAEIQIPESCAATKKILSKRGQTTKPETIGVAEYVSDNILYYHAEFTFKVVIPKQYNTTNHHIETIVRKLHNQPESDEIRDKELFTVTDNGSNWILFLQRKEPPIELGKGITYRICWAPPDTLPTI
jgi:hypothetical protein